MKILKETWIVTFSTGTTEEGDEIKGTDPGRIPKEGEENFVGDSEIIALGGASNETKDRPLG